MCAKCTNNPLDLSAETENIIQQPVILESSAKQNDLVLRESTFLFIALSRAEGLGTLKICMRSCHWSPAKTVGLQDPRNVGVKVRTLKMVVQIKPKTTFASSPYVN
jgi:hypothetical protein